MSLETNFNVAPYFDDYNEEKLFYKILFKPSVAVQTREINQLQTILQNQIERFGSHVFKNGTIVGGINFEYLPYYPFVKILDVTTTDQPVDLLTYNQYWLKNTANLVSKVVDYADGLTSRDPDLNTLYLQYLNSGASNSASSYSNNDVLTVYDRNWPVFSVNVYNGGVNFSNSDVIVFMSALSVNTNSGTFTTSDVLTQATTGAQAQVTEVNATAFSNTLILKVKPLTADLTNTSANSVEWTFVPGYNVTGSSSGASANVVSLVGSGAAGTPITDSLGVVSSIQVTSGGSAYLITPHTTIKPLLASATVAALNVQSQNYLTKITVANNTMSAPVVGNGYAFAVTGGLIYQKGHFLKVDPQSIVVKKYTDNPDQIVVGFDTAESVVSSVVDTSLLDNATGEPNETAPGADRLKLQPTLVVLTKTQAESNTSFLPLVEFALGEPYKENRVTVYNTLAKEFERRTSESSGDYVTDPFTVSTKDLVISAANSSPNTTHFQVIVDPGVAYISGTRIETLENTLVAVPKATDTRYITNQLVTASYGSYTIVNELVGSFNVAAGSSVSLRDTAGDAITTTAAGVAIVAPGAEIGTAKLRSMMHDTGVMGLPTTQYELYLFSITMNAGKNFRDVRSVYYNGAVDGLADVKLQYDPSLNANVAVLRQSVDRQIVFDTGFTATAVVNAASYPYRAVNESLSLASNGNITISLSASEETFPYTPSTQLSDNQIENFVLVPTANAQATANLAGGAVVTNNSLVINDTSLIDVGDFLKVANTTANQIFQIAAIANSTVAVTTANATTMNTISANAVLFFPAFRPLRFTTSGNMVLSANSKVITANIGHAVSSGVAVAGSYVVQRNDVTEITRSVYRDAYVRFNISNNAGGVAGPWSLGLPDVIRLKEVYIGNSSVDTTYPKVTKNFFVNNGQTGDTYQLAALNKMSDSNLVLTGSDYLVAKVDILQHSGEGHKTVSSFTIDDTKTLADSINTINTFEIPDFGNFDLRNTIDFRPATIATANVANNANLFQITTNPSNVGTLSASTKYFPTPDSQFTYDVEHYLSRKDRVVLNRNGSFEVLTGMTGAASVKAPATPMETISLGIITIPAYPSVGAISSNTISTFMTRLVGSANGVRNPKKKYHMIKSDATTPAISRQPAQYKMTDIAALERRLKNVEAQVSFNTLENEINKLNIPSSLDPSVSRFKNGFFVDSFIDNVKVDEANKEFAAYIDFERGELHPEEMHVNMQMAFKRSDTTTNNSIVNNTLMLPYTEQRVVTQPIATGSVAGSGVRNQFQGEISVTPKTFSVEGQFEQTVTLSLAHAQPVGSYGGCKIICTKLHELGLLPDHIFLADQKFGNMLRASKPSTYRGYVAWATTVVEWMEGKGPQFMFWIRDPEIRAQTQKAVAIKWAQKIATPWANHMAYIMGEAVNDSRAGRAIMKFGLLVSSVVGRFSNNKPQQKGVIAGLSLWVMASFFYMISQLKDKES